MKDANIPGQLSVPALRGGTDIGKMGGLSRFSGLPRLRRTRVKAGSFLPVDRQQQGRWQRRNRNFSLTCALPNRALSDARSVTSSR